MRTARSVVAALCVVTGAAAVWAQQVPPFRLGVDAIPLDVLVLDKNQRPVRGLTRADFTILEDGQPQPMVSFDEVRLADPPAPTAPWMLEAGLDVISNSEPFRRLVMIVMDDGNTGVNFSEPRSVRKIANAVIDQLGPDDMAAVIYTYFGRPQNFTRDRQTLRAAVEAFQPHYVNMSGRVPRPLACDTQVGIRIGGCAVDTLKTIGEFLRTAPPGRKTLIYVSPGVNFAFSPFNPTVSTQIFALQEMLQALQLSNVSVYAVDPTGVQLQGGTRDPNVLDFAENTGGRSVRNDNEAWLQIPSIFRENGSYYLMGYQSTHPNPDGHFRKIEVKVNRPDVVVRNRTGYYARKPEKSKSIQEPPSALNLAMSSGLPGGTIPLRLNAAAFAVPGKREADVALVIGLGEFGAAGDTPRRVDVVATAFDKDWKPKGAFTQTVELAPHAVPDARWTRDVSAHLPLRPGRYEIRVVADAGNGTGNVYVDVDVPDFAGESLSASGLVLQRAGVSTTVRDFAAADRITAFLRVYQHDPHAAAPSVTARIVDDAGRTVVSETTAVSPAGDSPRSADYRFELPLSTLRPGAHLLTVELAVGSKTIRRDARFSVR